MSIDLSDTGSIDMQHYRTWGRAIVSILNYREYSELLWVFWAIVSILNKTDRVITTTRCIYVYVYTKKKTFSMVMWSSIDSHLSNLRPRLL